ncbi:MAG: MATE family efflux transporter [Bacillota bacterium]|jgi:putative MATE family efflux protein
MKLMKARNIDLSSGPMIPRMLLFMLPLIGGSIFQQLYNTADFLFVGNLLDKHAAAAVGVAGTVTYCAIGMFMGISVGTNVVAARYVGEKNEAKVKKVLNTSMSFAFIFGVLMMILAVIFTPQIYTLLNTPADVLVDATRYTRIFFLSLPFMIIYNMGSGFFRARGNSSTPFWILVICGFLNVALDAFFLIVVPLGINGVAFSTVFSQMFSAALTVAGLMRSDPFPMKVFVTWAIDRETLASILRVGLPAGIQTVLITVSNVMVQYHINGFGGTAVAAFATYYKLENFVYLPIMAISQTVTTFVAQNDGAGNYPRLWRGTVFAVLFSAAVTAVIAGLIVIFPKTVFGWFIRSDDVVAAAISIGLVTLPFYWLSALGETLGGAVRGLGYALTSMVVVVTCLCGWRILLLTLLAQHTHTLEDIARVYPESWAPVAVAFAVIFCVIFRRRRKERAKADLEAVRES